MFFFLEKYDKIMIDEVGEQDMGIEYFIASLNARIEKIQAAISKLQNAISMANNALSTISSVESVTSTQFLAGEVIDRGKVQEMRSTCETIISDASQTIESCNAAIAKINEAISQAIADANKNGGQ